MKKQRKTTKKDQKRDQKERYEIARIRRKSDENTRIRAKSESEFAGIRAISIPVPALYMFISKTYESNKE